MLNQIAISLVFLTLVGCNAIPFYRQHSKNAQGLRLSQEGVAAFDRREFDTAAKSFEESLTLNQHDSETLRYYAETLWAQGKHQQSVDTLFSALVDAKSTKSQDNQIAIFQSLGEKYLLMGKLDQARWYADKMIARMPRKYEGWKIRADVLAQSGKYEEAMTDYYRALGFVPNNPELLSKLGELQNRLGQHDLALATWQSVGRLYATSAEPFDVLYGKSSAYYSLGRLEEATEHLLLAMNKEPDHKEIYPILVDCYLQKQDRNNAEQVARMACNRYPELQDEFNRKMISVVQVTQDGISARH